MHHMLIYIGWCDEVTNVSYQQNFADMYWQYLLIKAFTQCYIIVLDGMLGNRSYHFIFDWWMQILYLFRKFSVNTNDGQPSDYIR